MRRKDAGDLRDIPPPRGENMTSDMAVAAQTREERGSNAARRLRAKGVLPAVLNDASGASVALTLDKHNFEQILVHHTGENLLLDLAIDGGSARKVLLTEVQHNHVNGSVVHADFREVSLTEKITVSIVIELIGEAAGVNAGGVLEQVLREVEVECLPSDIVETIELDISALDIGDSVSVADVKVPATLVILTAVEQTVAMVATPRAEVEEEAEEEAAAEGAEPAEVAGEEKQEEE
jgi:large subunit ribosomal protein L25